VPSHSSLVQNAEDAINEVFSDSSVERSETRESLESLREVIDDLLATLN
jgi:hypothetical protein